jgi:hypothetical protein
MRTTLRPHVPAPDLTLGQAVRCARRIARRFLDEQNALYEDMCAFGAPSECWEFRGRGIYPSLVRRYVAAIKRLGLDEGTLNHELEEATRKEFAHRPPFDPDEPYWLPRIHDEACALLELYESPYANE